MSLILYGHNNTFTGVFQKDCIELLLRNQANCGSTCMALQSNLCAGRMPDPIFLNIEKLHLKMHVQKLLDNCCYSAILKGISMGAIGANATFIALQAH